MANAALSLLPLPAVQEEEELTGSDTLVQSSGQTPTAKRQRRLTLTAMTGLISELAQDASSNSAPVSETCAKQEAIDSASVPNLRVSQHTVHMKDGGSFPLQRDPSPVRRLKRARASISATATAEVMAAQAARILTASGSKSCGRSHGSESSDSTEEEDDSLALRVRRAQAFECGAQVGAEASANAETKSLHDRERDLSPGSKIAFSQGVRAAQVAAKVAAKMASPLTEPIASQRHVVVGSSPSARKSGPEVPSLTLQLRGGA